MGTNCEGGSLKQGRLAPGPPVVALGLPSRETHFGVRLNPVRHAQRYANG